MSVAGPTRIRFGVLLFICTLSLITYLDRVCIARVSQDIREDLSISATDMGLVFGAFALGYALFEVPGGWLGDRWGSRRVLMRIVIWWSVFTALTGCVWLFSFNLLGFTVTALTALVSIRFFFGAGEAGAYPNLARVVKVWFPFRERAIAQGAVWMSARLGGAVAPFVIGRLSTLLGWRPAFWVLGCIGVVWSVAFFVWFRERPEDHPDCNDAERELIHPGSTLSPLDARMIGTAETKWRGEQNTDIRGEPGVTAGRVHVTPVADVPGAPDSPPVDGADSLPDALRPYSPVAAIITMVSLCVASFGVSFGWYFYPTWQPEYLSDVFGITYANSELLTGLPFLCGAIGSIVGGGISDALVNVLGRRWGRSLVGLVGFTGAGLCVLGTGFAAQAWQAVALLCLAFLINDLAIPVIWAVSADVGGRYVGTVSGLMNTVGAFGAMLSPALIPRVKAALLHLSPAAHWRVVFVGLAGSWLVAAAAWLFIDASRPLFARQP
jgi:MFS family permease